MATTFEREALYEAVWSEPVTVVAKRHGLSDNGLRKICAAMDIPVPTRGHWARVAAGNAIRRKPLPPTTKPTTYHSDPPKQEPTFRLPEDGVWLAQRSAFDTDPGNAPTYEREPGSWHLAVNFYREELSKSAKELEASRRAVERYERLSPAAKARSPTMDGYLWRHTQGNGGIIYGSPFSVSVATCQRALAILNALVLALAARGFKAEASEKGGRILVRGHGGEVALRISERVESKPRKLNDPDRVFGEMRKTATGVLRLYLEPGTSSIEDRNQAPLETQLGPILEAVYRAVIRSRVAARQHEEWRRRREAEEAQREAAERTRAQAERVRAKERQRREALLEEALRWSRALTLRSYVAHVVNTASEGLAPAGLDEWHAWALSVANDLDPTAVRIDA